jgi:hypothetical protein
MKDPVDHILRPQLPWRDDPGMTECGYDSTKVTTLDRAEYAERLKSLGRQRAAMMTCMTCSGTYERWARWEDDPRRCIGREVEWECGSSYYRNSDRGWRLHDELVAIAAIVKDHRAVFDAMVAESQARRDWLEKKADHEKAKEQKTITQLKPRL